MLVAWGGTIKGTPFVPLVLYLLPGKVAAFKALRNNNNNNKNHISRSTLIILKVQYIDISKSKINIKGTKGVLLRNKEKYTLLLFRLVIMLNVLFVYNMHSSPDPKCIQF